MIASGLRSLKTLFIICKLLENNPAAKANCVLTVCCVLVIINHKSIYFLHMLPVRISCDVLVLKKNTLRIKQNATVCNGMTLISQLFISINSRQFIGYTLLRYEMSLTWYKNILGTLRGRLYRVVFLRVANDQESRVVNTSGKLKYIPLSMLTVVKREQR